MSSGVYGRGIPVVDHLRVIATLVIIIADRPGRALGNRLLLAGDP